MTRFLIGATALVLLMAGAAPAAGPAVVISVKGFDELLADVDYLGNVVNHPEFGSLPPALINQLTQGQGLKGLDGSKPLGAYITLSPQGQPQDIVVFVPVKDQKEFAATLEMLAPNPEKMGELTKYQFPSSPNPIIAKAGAKHFFFAPAAEMLKETADPAKLVSVPADISIEVDLTQIPEGLKEMILSQAEASQQIAPVPEGQEAGAKLVLAGFRRVLTDGSRLTLSLDINSKAKATVLDLAFSAKSGTPLAQATANYAKSQSPFTGLVTKQTVGSLLLSTPLSADVEAAFKQIVDQGEKEGLAKLPTDPAEKEIATSVLKRSIDVIRSTIQRGRMDHSVVVNAIDGKLQIISASKLAKGDQVGKIIEDIVKAKPEAGAKIKMNVATVGKAKVHAVTMPPDEDAQKYFGTGPAHLAFTDDSAIFVLGGDSLATLKAALEKPAASSGAARPPISLRVGLSKVLALANDFNPTNIPPAVFELSKTALEGGFDQVGLEVSSQPQGVKIRLEVQEGVLRLATVVGNQN